MDDVEQGLADWSENTAIFERLGDVLFVTTALADMAGQLMVAGRETQVIQLAANAPSPKPFLDLPWADAINYFKARGLVKDTDFQTLLAGYAQRSAVARRLMLQQVQSEVMRHLSDAIAKGETFPEFAGKVDVMTNRLGLAPGAPSYLQMVFRTNVQSAYGAGRYRAMSNPVVQRARPFVQYRTVGDARVRDEHAVLDGKTYRADDQVWQRIAPPNGFNCRCSMITLSQQEAEGSEISTSIPDDYVPTPGFDQPPTAVLRVDDGDVEQAPAPRQPRVQQPTQAPAAPAPIEPAPAAPPTTPTPYPQKPPTQPQPDAPAQPPSKRVGEITENIFGKKLSEPDIDDLAGSSAAKLPSGYTVDVRAKDKVNYFNPDDKSTDLFGAIKDPSGNVVGAYQRYYTLGEDGRPEVSHASFFLDESVQNTGIGRELFNAQVDAYEKHGVSKVNLDAAEIGKYVWTKAGFEWTRPGQFDQVRDLLRGQLTDRYGTAATDKLMSAINTPQDIARLTVDGERVGKDFLINLGGVHDIINMAQAPAKITRL